MLQLKTAPTTATQSDTKQPVITQDFFLCFVSFLSLLLNNLFGMWAIVGFLMPWILVFLRKSSVAQRGVVANWPLLLFPALAALSTLWSDDPSWTFKASVELFATVAIGIMAGCCIRPRSMIAALLSALLIVVVLSVITAWSTLVSYTGNEYVNGIFGSKNAFASTLSLLFLTAVAVVLNKSQPRLFRSSATISIVVTPVLLYVAHSLGAILAVAATLIVLAAVLLMKRLPRPLRLLSYLFFALPLLAATLLPFFIDDTSTGVLNFFGKDASLTGRTYLWEHAWQNIAERPILGTGYGAFWRIDNPRAQALWFALQVPAGAGFNFHNEYLELLVELGLGGLVLCTGYLLIIIRKGYRAMMTAPSPEHMFAFIVLVFLIIRSPIEVAIFSQFNIVMILFCSAWTYFRTPSLEKVRHNNGCKTP